MNGDKFIFSSNQFAIVGVRIIGKNTMELFIIKNFEILYSETFKVYKKDKSFETEEYIGYTGKYISDINEINGCFEYQIVNNDEIEIHRIDFQTLQDCIWSKDTLQNCKKSEIDYYKYTLLPGNDNEYINRYLSFDFSKDSYIILYYALMNAAKAYIIDDIIFNENLNFKFSFKKDNFEVIQKIYILGSIGRKNKFSDGYYIRGYKPEFLWNFFKLNEIKKMRLKEKYGKEFIDGINKINLDLIKELKCDNKEFEKFLKDRFSPSIDSLCYTVDGVRRIPHEHRNQLRRELSEKIYNELIEKRKINVKWKNEAEMYRIVKSMFPDAIYQYRSEFLNKQSLDVYIPSKQIGFEYQGLQHFKAIDFFGGKESLDKNIERDIRKKRLCKENGIDLIEWYYYEPVNFKVLKAKLINKCDINQDNFSEKIEMDYLTTKLYNLPHINIYNIV